MRHYQKPLITFIGILLAFVLLTLMTSCSSKKPIASSTTEVEKTTKEKNDSIVYQDNNKAILDAFSLYLGAIQTGAGSNCDSLCQDAVSRVLKNAQIEKQSGDNSYKLLYDENQKLLKIIMQIGATSNKSVAVQKQSEITESKKAAETIPVPYVPDFWRYSAYLGWVSTAFALYWIIKRVRTWAKNKFSL